MDESPGRLLPPFDTTVSRMLLDAAESEPGRVILEADGEEITVSALADLAYAHADRFRKAGMQEGDVLLTMLGNGPDHAAMFLAASLAGLRWVPVNPQLRGPSLAHVVSTVRPGFVCADAEETARLRDAGLSRDAGVLEADGWRFEKPPVCRRGEPERNAPDAVRAILFTSGTTGPPKGVMVTERMLVASAAGCAVACDCRDGDAFLMWEPMHHIGGCQLLVMALCYRVRLIMVKRFSASGFWPEIDRSGISKIHYLGGILEILLKAMPGDDDRKHAASLAFGGGCRRDIWEQLEERFGIPLREVYGMTEASSFTTVNTRGVVGSVGTPVPWFDVAVTDEAGNRLPPGMPGEIVVMSSHPGLFTPGYLASLEATARLLREGKLHTGDLGRFDDDGNLFFLGRMTDSLRRRGENISAWEVETALAANPDIAESAVVGVPAEIGEHEILCFVTMRDGSLFDPDALADWARSALPPHHVPRYWKQVDAFERTPSQRIRKDLLDRNLSGAADTAART